MSTFRFSLCCLLFFALNVAAFALPPVQWDNISLTAEPNQTVSMRWNTLNEDQCLYFGIERSFDGITFTEIGTMAGHRNGAWSYEFVDDAPVVGKTYYRLKQVDLDITIHYSRTVFVVVETRSVQQATITPNPCNGYTTVSFHAAVYLHLNISFYDMSGRWVHSEPYEAAEGFNHIYLNISDIPAGVYFLEIRANELAVRRKILILPNDY